METGRERIGEAWRDLHEAVYYAADATGCAQFISFADLQSRRGDPDADIASLHCIQKTGRLASTEVQQYQRLHLEHTRLIRAANSDWTEESVGQFLAAAQALEARIWRVVPDERLPSGMLAQVNSPTGEGAYLVRKDRRGGTFPS
jgi:hypothetical protein